MLVMLAVVCHRLLTLRARLRLRASRAAHSGPLTVRYFAFGANLDERRFRRLGLRYQLLGRAHLPGYQLTFDMPCEYEGVGFAGVAPYPSAEVWGLVYALSAASLALLDVLEWVPFGSYRRIRRKVVLDDGQALSAWLYTSRNPEPDLRPKRRYLDAIRGEAALLDLAPQYLAYLATVEPTDRLALRKNFTLWRHQPRRFQLSALQPLYTTHDRFREKLQTWI